MNVLLVSNTEFLKRPHLVRLSHKMAANGVGVSFLGVGDNHDESEENLYIEHLKLSGSRLYLILIPLIQARRIIAFEKVDLLMATHPYALLACTLSRWLIRQSPSICYYPAEIYDGRSLWHLRLIEKLCFQSVESIISPNKPRLDYLFKRYGKRPFFILPNSTPDMPEFSKYTPPTKKGPLRLIYLGTSNVKRRCLDTLIIAVDKANFNISLRIAVGGRTEHINEIRALISNTTNKHRFEFVDYVQYPQHFEYMKMADVGVMLYHPNISLNYQFCEPNKLYEYCMMSLPVLSSNQNHLTSNIEKYNFGVCVNPLSLDSVLEGLERMKNSNIQELRLNARNWFSADGNYDIHAKNVVNWIHERR